MKRAYRVDIPKASGRIVRLMANPPVALKGRSFKFPDPGDRSANDPAILCPAERVLALYNQDSGDTAQRIAKKVKAWFAQRARELGWTHVAWFKEAGTNHGAGCVLAIMVLQFVSAPAGYFVQRDSED